MLPSMWFAKSILLLERITRDELGWLETRSRVREFSRNATVVPPAQGPTAILLVISGSVIVRCQDDRFPRFPSTTLEIGDVFGDLPNGTLGEPPLGVQARDHARVALIPVESLEVILRHDHPRAFSLHKPSDGLRGLSVFDVLFRSSQERLLGLLVELLNTVGQRLSGGRVDLGGRWSTKKIARATGLSAGVVAWWLQQYQARGWLQYHRRLVIVEPVEFRHALEHLRDDDRADILAEPRPFATRPAA